MKTVSLEQITAGVVQMLGDEYDCQQMQEIKMVLFMVLSGYCITEEESELSTERDMNQELLKGLEIDMKLRGCAAVQMKA